MLPQGHQTYNSSNEKKNWVRDSDTWVRNNYEKMFILTSSSTVVVDVNFDSRFVRFDFVDGDRNRSDENVK